MVKKLPANPGDAKDAGSIPESEDPHSLGCKSWTQLSAWAYTHIYLSTVYECKHTDTLTDARKKKILRERD